MWSALLVASIVLSAGQGATLWPPGCGDCGGASSAPGNGGGRPGGRAEAPARDGPSCTFSHLDASVRLNEDTGSLDASVRISLVTGRDTASLILRLRPGMAVSGVADEGSGPLEFQRTFWYFYNISLGRTVGAGTSLNITVDYGGQVRNTPDGGASFWDYVGPEGSWVRTYGGYFPYDENWSRTTSRVSINAPGDKLAVSSGRLVAKTPDAGSGTVTWVYVNDRPVSGISFLAGNLTRSSFSFGSHGYDLYLRADHAGVAAPYASELARIEGFYSSLLGEPGFTNLTVAELPSTFAAWGQSMPSMMWLASRNFDGPLPYRILSHELGHQWWGIDVEGEGAGENFIQEGFAGYVEAMYEMAYYGSRGYLDFLRQQYINRFVQGAGTEPMLVSNDYDLAAYKGPWVLHMLRFLVGDEPFNRTLLAFHRDFSGRRADHWAFQDVLERTTGQNLTEFFHLWLYTSGRLDYAVAEALFLEGPGGLGRVQLWVESRGLVGGMPMDTGIYREGGMRSFLPRSWNGSGANVTLPLDVDYLADAVKLDPYQWLLDAYPSNNEAPTRAAFHDFSVDGLRAPPDSPLENQSFGVALELAGNSSEGDTEVVAGLAVDGEPGDSATVRLGSGNRTQVNFSLSLPAGRHRLEAVLDPGDRFYERNEGNNRATLTVEVRPLPTPLPNLRIPPGGIFVSPQAVGWQPAELGVLVENPGQADAEGVTVDIWVDSTDTGYVGRSAGMSVPAGERRPAAVAWTAVAGWHQLTARVNPPENGNESDPTDNEATAQLYINAPPVALLAASPGEAASGDWVELSGLSSTDDTRVAYYHFDFGDGDMAGWLNDATTSHRYLVAGTFQARLKVLDDTGAGSDWSAPIAIRVRDGPPVAVISVQPRAAGSQTSFRFSSQSYASGGNLTEHSWAFGDGTTARGRLVNHTFGRHGDFTVTLTVRDERGQSARAALTVTARDLPPVPVIAYDGKQAVVGERVRFSAQNSTDPDDPFQSIGFVWDFGGGQKASGVEASYVFPRPGYYLVTLTATDGNQSAQSALIVRAVPPAAGPAAGKTGWLPWAVLAVLLAALAALVAFIVLPDRRMGREEEE